MATAPDQTAYCVLAQWCSVRKEWMELPERYEAAYLAEQAATERGVYRVTYICEGRRLDMEPFARIGDG